MNTNAITISEYLAFSCRKRLKMYLLLFCPEEHFHMIYLNGFIAYMKLITYVTVWTVKEQQFQQIRTLV